MSPHWSIPLLCVLLSCGRSAAPVGGELDRAKFREVLTESMLIEARLSHELIIDKRADGPAARYYAEMFKQQGVTEAQFKNTYERYVQQPDSLKKIYEDVLNDLQQRADTTAH